MDLSEIPTGREVFIDSNIFIYSALKDRRFHRQTDGFLKRVEAGEIFGFASVFVLNEVLHQLMRAEIARGKSIPLADTAGYLKTNPNEIKKLKFSWSGLSKILAIPNLTVCDVTESAIRRGIDLSRSQGLLATDGVHAAVMQEYRLTALASNDPDFKRVAWVELYSP